MRYRSTCRLQLPTAAFTSATKEMKVAVELQGKNLHLLTSAKIVLDPSLDYCEPEYDITIHVKSKPSEETQETTVRLVSKKSLPDGIFKLQFLVQVESLFGSSIDSERIVARRIASHRMASNDGLSLEMIVRAAAMLAMCSYKMSSTDARWCPF